MRSGNGFHDGKTNSQTTGTRRYRPARLSEEVEDMRQERGRYTQAVVLDGDDKIVSVREHGHVDMATRRCVFHCVVQEVIKGL